MDDLMPFIVQSALGANVAILVVFLLRLFVRSYFGATTAYGLWLMVPVAAFGSLLPAEFVYFTELDQQTLLPLEAEIARQPTSAVKEPSAGLVETQGISIPNIFTSLSVIWLVGFVLSLGGLVVGQYRYLRKHNLRAMLDRVHEADQENVGPAVIGIVSPRIVVPKNFERLYTKLERSLILAHEHAHIRAGDMRLNVVAVFLKCLNWFNPLVYLAHRIFRMDQELACDERVMRRHGQHRRVYAETLLKSQIAMQTAPIGCAWLPESMHPLKQRVMHLMGPELASGRRMFGLVVLGVVTSLSGVGTWAAFASHIIYLPTSVTNHSSEADQQDHRRRAQGVSLMEALQDGRELQVKMLLENGADVNYYLRGDGTPLIVAVRQGNAAMVDALIAAGADVNKSAPSDGNPLIMAARRGNIGIVKKLIAQGADVNGFVLYDETPLIGAAAEGRLETARLLIEHGADVNLTVENGHKSPRSLYRSPLGQAKLYGHSDMISLLVEHGAKTTTKKED